MPILMFPSSAATSISSWFRRDANNVFFFFTSTATDDCFTFDATIKQAQGTGGAALWQQALQLGVLGVLSVLGVR